MDSYLLIFLLFLPLLGVIALWGHSLFWSSDSESNKLDEQYRWIGLGFSLVTFLLSLLLIPQATSSNSSSYNFVVNVPWIEALGARFHLGVDGISVWLVLLTTFLLPICILVTWSVSTNVRAYISTLLLLETAIIGVSVSLDMLLFYLFFELTIIPAGFLIGVWGAEREKRVPAAIKFFIFTIVGSLFMLIGIIGVYFLSGINTFDLVEVTNHLNQARIAGKPLLNSQWSFMLWLAFGFGFFVKVPLWPLHSWLPEAYVQAPTSGSILMSGVMAKMGAYGLIRFNLALFPETSTKVAPYVMTLAIIGVIYGAMIAMVQSDLKRLIAYSSLSHLGLVVVGIFAATEISLQGSLYQMINHGLSTGALFVCVAYISQRKQSREISDFGGVGSQMPGFSTAFIIIAFSSIGLPLLCGFVGEILILVGTFSSAIPGAKIFAILGTTGVVLSAIYILRKMQLVVFGTPNPDQENTMTNMTTRERFALIPLVVMAVVMGVTPMFFLKSSQRSIEAVSAMVTNKPAK